MYQLQLMVAIPQHLGISTKKQPQVTPNEVSYSAVITACDPWEKSILWDTNFGGRKNVSHDFNTVLIYIYLQIVC